MFFREAEQYELFAVEPDTNKPRTVGTRTFSRRLHKVLERKEEAKRESPIQELARLRNIREAWYDFDPPDGYGGTPITEFQEFTRQKSLPFHTLEALEERIQALEIQIGQEEDT